MSVNYLLSEKGNYYKANLHNHTTVSDGKYSPSEIKAIYQDYGYSIIAYTDHDRLIYHKDLCDDKFLALAGYEFGINDKNSSKCYHFNFYAKDPESAKVVEYKQKDGSPLEYSVESMNRYIEYVKENGFYVTFNHPSWSLQDQADFMGLEGLFAFEIYNHSCEVENRTGHDYAHYNHILRSKKKLYCTMTDDNHNHRPRDSYDFGSGGGYVMIKSEKLEYNAITDALLAGNFYSSMGPEIYNLYIKDNKLICDCSPVQCAFMLTKNRHAPNVQSNKADITHFEFELNDAYEYIRIEIFDEYRKYACSNPYYL